MIIYDTKQSSVYQLDTVSTTTCNIQPQFLLPTASLAPRTVPLSCTILKCLIGGLRGVLCSDDDVLKKVPLGSWEPVAWRLPNLAFQ